MKIAIIGAGGHAKVVAEVAVSAGYEIAFFVADEKTEHFGYPVICMDEFLNSDLKIAAIGIGDNGVRKNVYGELRKREIVFPVLMHSSVVMSSSSSIGEATVVMPNAVINPESNIGIGCIINSGAIIEHDCALGDFVHISPNAALAGGVYIGELSHMGIGSCAIQQIKIGKNCVIGAGASVISDIKDNSIAVGVPAKIKKDKK